VKSGLASAGMDDYHPKEQVMSTAVDGVFSAHPYQELLRRAQARFDDEETAAALPSIGTSGTEVPA
jgi:hypothetical protein